MQLRSFSVVIALMSATLITGLGNQLPPALIEGIEFGNEVCSSSEPSGDSLPATNPVPAPPHAILISKDKVLVSAYYDALSILSTSNRCSEFFGNPLAMSVFNLLASEARKDFFSSTVAMRMHGNTVIGQDHQGVSRYRTFTKVSLNGNGPFYRRSRFRSEATILGVGTFEPDTREVRVLILLHELGHLLKGPDGNWLLPDDGGNEPLSRDNSLKIEKLCGKEIRNLGDPEVIRNLALRSHEEQKLAMERNGSEQSVTEASGNH